MIIEKLHKSAWTGSLNNFYYCKFCMYIVLKNIVFKLLFFFVFSHHLKVIDATGLVAEKYVIMSQEKRKTFNIQVKLPSFISCSHCVLQWTYVAGNQFQNLHRLMCSVLTLDYNLLLMHTFLSISANTWGTCANGTEAVGCGGQETFINCKISSSYNSWKFNYPFKFDRVSTKDRHW